MSIIFRPTGTLSLAEQASLPESRDGMSISSGAMARCKNLRLDEEGTVKTRDGSRSLNSTVLAGAVKGLSEQGGYRYSYAGGSVYRNESSIESGLAVAFWSAIKYNSYASTTQNVFFLDGTYRKRIEGSSVYNWGIEAPDTASTLAVGASTGLTGDYLVKYTYCRKEGSTVVCESNPSPASSSQALSNQSLSITWTASSDSQVTHVRIYRTSAGGSTYYHDQDVAIGTTTIDSTTADGSLGTEVATNHYRPTAGTFVFGPTYNGIIFICYNNLLYYSLAKQPEYWPVDNYIEVGPPQFALQCGVFWNGQPYAISKRYIYLIQGTGSDTFFPYPTASATGAQGPNAALAVAGHGIYHVGSDGIYLFSGKDIKITQLDFEPIFRGVTTNGMPGVKNPASSWLGFFKNRLYFGYTGDNDVYPTNCIRFDLTTGRSGYYKWGFEIPCIAVDETNNRLLAGDANGYVWELETGTHDNGSDIDWEMETKSFTLPTRRHFPRWCKYDVDASEASGVTGKIYLDGKEHQSHSITGVRAGNSSKRRLIKSGNGNTESIRISGSGSIKIFGIEAE